MILTRLTLLNELSLDRYRVTRLCLSLLEQNIVCIKTNYRVLPVQGDYNYIQF